MQIDQYLIDEVISRSDIVTVIGKSLKLKRSGGNYFACCPFHKEKTASLSINVKDQFFHCFGCGESGNVISFIMKYLGLDFVDAIKHLAHDCGVHIPESDIKISKEVIQQQKEHKLTLNETLDKTVKFYQMSLKNTKHANEYIVKRGLSPDIIQKFLLGYANDNFNALANAFNDYHTNNYLLEAGLVIKNSSGKLYDRFRNRIIFPIRNTRGSVIGFGGRIIDSGEPKYLNSPETTLFNKSNELYGLHEAQKVIREKKYTIVVEGYMDVIALSQFGVENVVATMGTAATEEHIKKLFRLCDDIYYCFDGDNAGRKAAWRALERSIAHVTDLKSCNFVFLPEKHDPDSFIREFGEKSFINQIKDGSMSLSTYLMKELSLSVNIESEEGKAKLISLAKPYIEQTKAMALQVMLKKQLANIVQLEPSVLESILNNRSRYAFYNSRWNKNQISLPTEKLSQPKINKINTVIKNALINVNWVHNYRLPDAISEYSTEIKELILLLDYIGQNYNLNEKANLNDITNCIEFTALDVQNQTFSQNDITITEKEFQATLENLFGFSKSNVIKIPKIPMRNKQ